VGNTLELRQWWDPVSADNLAVCVLVKGVDVNSWAHNLDHLEPWAELLDELLEAETPLLERRDESATLSQLKVPSFPWTTTLGTLGSTQEAFKR
jgi:hypothetical protein